MSKHTPGDWNYTYSMRVPLGSEMVELHVVENKDTEVAYALNPVDARLIAKAPEMRQKLDDLYTLFHRIASGELPDILHETEMRDMSQLAGHIASDLENLLGASA